VDPLKRLQTARLLAFGFLALAVLGIIGWPLRRTPDTTRATRGSREDRTAGEPAVRQAPPTESEPMRVLRVGFPTPQTNLLATHDETVYMATASGRIESALYGSTRTGLDSAGRVVPRFHAALDIAPMERDRRGRPRDPVFAIADGKVAYINAAAGNSNYGRYVVIEHDDAVGPIYSLYAHLASVAGSLATGQRIARGDTLGIMGNSSTMNIPMVRAHLHLEVCMMMSRRFTSWCEAEGLDTRHGLLHGWNLNAIDPLALYRAPDAQFSMLAHMRQLAPAFELVVRSARPIDYFDIYPALWQGEAEASGSVVMAVCEGGTVIAGRLADESERSRLAGGRRHAVLHVDTEVLGRNGRRLIARRGENWEVSSLGERWLSILLH